MKKFISLIAMAIVCLFIILEQRAQINRESEQNSFPEGKIIYLTNYEKGTDMAKKEAEKFTESSLMEGMTSIRAVFAGAEAGVNDRKIEKILFDKSKTRAKFRELGFLRAKSADAGFEIEFTDAEEIEKLAIGGSHGGILAY
ncbi:MAG: hypothetical protein IJ021_00875, partial [Clostridia bacterium]|nr:hypothetical protein [Clostridia bacterium]